MTTQSIAQQKSHAGGHGSYEKSLRNHSFSDATAQFLDSLAAAGVAPVDTREVIGDGKLRRYRIAGDRLGTKNGWYVLHLESIPAGAFGSWKLGINHTWCAVDKHSLTHEQREDNRRHVEAAKQAARAMEEQRHRDAATRAQTLWNQSKSALADHPYLIKKSVKPGLARMHRELLLLPIFSLGDKLTGLQFINPEGTKRMLSGTAKKGSFIPVQMHEKAAKTLICEGWATGQTLAENAPQARVLAAIDAGNLEPVAIGAREKWPDSDLIICCDFDEVGRAKGRAAALAANAKILPPPGTLLPDWATDWNDYAAFVRGREVGYV